MATSSDEQDRERTLLRGSARATGLVSGPPDAEASAEETLVGRVIADRYHVLALLGEGGMGRVYRAEHIGMNRQCAIKVMNPALLHDQRSRARFAREAASAARILHPNVAAVFDYGEADQLVYLVMEYVDGEPLSAILARERMLEPLRAIDLTRQIAEGLAAAHELGIVHRDLKPDNVIVARTRAGKEVAKIVDFGIAKVASEFTQDTLTKSGLVIGTPEYMSPEQLLGDPVDARADIYSLGCILYQMIAGTPAFAAESREQMVRRRLNDTPPHVRDAVPEIPARLDAVIANMLARSPAERASSATEVRDALDPAFVLDGWAEAPVTPTPSIEFARPAMTTTLAKRATDPTLRPTVRLPRKRSSGGRTIAATLVIAALLFGGFEAWQRQAARAAAPAARSAAQTTAKRGSLPRRESRGRAAEAVAAPRAADSLRVTRDSAAAATLAGDADVELPIQRFANAVGRGDLAGAKAAAPGATSAVTDGLQRFFATVHPSTARVIYGPIARGADSAAVAFTVFVGFSYDGGETATSRLPYRAVLARRADGWAIIQLTPAK